MEFTKKDLIWCIADFQDKLERGEIETAEEIDEFADKWTTAIIN